MFDAISNAADRFDLAVRRFEEECKESGAYMPAIATRLRIYADEFADKYPDDTNEGLE